MRRHTDRHDGSYTYTQQNIQTHTQTNTQEEVCHTRRRPKILTRLIQGGQKGEIHMLDSIKFFRHARCPQQDMAYQSI